MLVEKQKSDDSEEESNHLPEVRIQVPHVAENGKQPSACDHKEGKFESLPEKAKNGIAAAPETILSDRPYKSRLFHSQHGAFLVAMKSKMLLNTISRARIFRLYLSFSSSSIITFKSLSVSM